MDPVLAVTEEMLSELPEWRRDLGLNLMNQYLLFLPCLTPLFFLECWLTCVRRVTRLVVVSWGRATKRQKQELEQAA